MALMNIQTNNKANGPKISAKTMAIQPSTKVTMASKNLMPPHCHKPATASTATRRVVKLGWSGLMDEHGAEIDWDDAEARAGVLDNHYILGPIRDAVYAELTGGNYAAAVLEKNS